MRSHMWLILLTIIAAQGAWTAPTPGTPVIPEGATPSPVIFIPGKCGSQIEARLDKKNSEHPHCSTQSDWYRIWLDVWRLIVPANIVCWSENIGLHYNRTSRRNHNTPGVEIRIPGWGDTEYSEYIDPSWTAFFMGNSGAYFVHTVNEFVSWGMERSTSIRVAPYDFRYSPHSQAEYFEKLRDLVEETYTINGGKKVVLMAHSMGGIYGQYFLQLQTQEWKDTYVKAYAPINTPWTGSSLLAYLYVSGYNWGLPIERPIVQGIMRDFETAVMMLPRGGPEDGAWGRDDVLIQTPRKNYTALHYYELFRDIGHLEGYEQYQNHQGGNYEYQHPGVDTYCIYSSGLDTPASFVFEEGQFPSGYADILYGPGDGTVDIRSLRACESFLREGGASHLGVVKEFVDMQHIDLLYDRRIYDFLKVIIFQD